MSKRKRSDRKRHWIRDLLLGCAALLALFICVLLVLLIPVLTAADAVMRSLLAPAPYDQPEKIETFTLPVNSDEPILTRHDYTAWVNITISGTIDLGSGHYHDAERLCNAEGSCKPYRGLRINGEYFNVYSSDLFSHDGYEFRYHHDGDAPSQISFQLITKDNPGATGAMEVEVFYPWSSFGRGGR